MLRLVILALSTAIALSPTSNACPMKGRCDGNGRQHRHGQDAGHHGQGKGMQCRMDETHDADMDVFHFLLDNRERITRTVTEIDGGVETVTESEDPEVVAMIRGHVEAMSSRITEGRPIHMRDPLFAEIFANADQIRMTVEETDQGVRVRETSDDASVAALIRAHAGLIDRFLENGRDEVRRNHEVPAAH